MHIVAPKCPEICQVELCADSFFENLSNLDVKFKNYTNWFIIGFWVLGGWLDFGIS